MVNDTGEPDAVPAGARQHTIDDLPDDTLMFLLPSRYCETDRLLDIAWSLFKNSPLGWGRVQAILDYVHNHIAFGYEHARNSRTAWEGYCDRTGVCRDFAHLAVALCRCMNIPARYCTGYLGDIGVPPVDAPMDFSAWFEVYSRRRLAHRRRTPQHPAHRPGANGPRPRRRRRRDQHNLRPEHADRVQGGDGGSGGGLSCAATDG